MKNLPIPNEKSPQDERDQAKGCGSCAFMVLGVVLPIVVGAYGAAQLQWDTETTLTISGGLFIICWIIAVGLALLIENISWLFSFLPTLGSLIYTLVPDFVPGPIDDITVLVVGIFFSVVLVVKKVAPVYVLLAVVVTGLYAWFGRTWIEGYVDEAALFLIVVILGSIVSHNYRQPEKYTK